ncbi:MAG: DUF3300 domain-containing protein [Nitrospirae bacterium]|nr:DUF3300 domain-containing protein [Nitrospirota bacterium]
MKIRRVINRSVCLLVILILTLPLQSLAQDAGGGAQYGSFSREQLAQMLAPVALFPDALLSQILMAATYPLEVVEADRWVKKNAGLEGDELDQALVDKEWDPSVKSLCHFPSIVSSMSDKIAQTTRLGDAFLGQQADVMAMIQELREKARETGNLTSTKEQKVTVERETIIIEPSTPEVVYVPSYDPYYVYGPWWYPAYPPYYWWPGPAVIGAGLVFWPGIYVGISASSWCYFDWYNHIIVLDWGRTHRFHRHRGDRDGSDRWHHDSEHRRGVAYRDRETARKFGQAAERSRESRRELRGFPERRIMDSQTRETTRRDTERTPLRSGGTVRPEKGRVREQIDRGVRPVIPKRENVFDGGGDARRESMESERGRSSREGAGQSTGESRGNDGGRSQGRSKGLNSGQDGRGELRRMGR